MRGAGAEQISVLVRTIVESKASKNVLHYFYTLGYKLDHELLKIGFAFRFHRGAQITVTGGGSGTPGPTISLPGGYKDTDPGILINIYYPIPTSYTYPGPTVWKG